MSIRLDVHSGSVLCVVCSGCNHNGKLYVSGGFRGPVHGHIDQFCCYDAECDVWRQRAPLTQPRSYHSMASVQDHIIVAGGVHYRGMDTFDDLLVIIHCLKNEGFVVNYLSMQFVRTTSLIIS